MRPSGINPPPDRVPQNLLTRGMDLVEQYNTMYPSRAIGGGGVPQDQFQGTQGPSLSSQEAADREARWLAETGQMLDEQGNVVSIPRVPTPQYAPPQGPAFASNPGVIRRAPEPIYGSVPYQGPQPDPRFFSAPTHQPRVVSPIQPFTPVQSIQSIDLERGIVWAEGRAFPFDLRRSQQVVYFALEVISAAFAEQLSGLLQRYGLVVANQGVPEVPPAPVPGQLPSQPEREVGDTLQVPGVQKPEGEGQPQQLDEAKPEGEKKGSLS